MENGRLEERGDERSKKTRRMIGGEEGREKKKARRVIGGREEGREKVRGQGEL